jgi:hypothetical protein
MGLASFNRARALKQEEVKEPKQEEVKEDGKTAKRTPTK